MQRVKEGNLDELSELFERYHVKLYNFFLKLTFDRDASQDLTQNLFYRVIKYRQSYKENYSFKSWIYQLARNQHIDYFHKNKKYSDRVALVEQYNDQTPEYNSIYNEEDYSRLDKALMKLAPEQLEILVLTRFQGLKYEEISKIKELSVPNVKVQVHRAIKQLKELFFKQE